MSWTDAQIKSNTLKHWNIRSLIYLPHSLLPLITLFIYFCIFSYPLIYSFFIPFISYSTHSFPQTLLEADMPEWQVLGILELFRMYERQEPFCTESTKVHNAAFLFPCLVVLTVSASLLLLFYLMIDKWLFDVLSHHHHSSHHTVTSLNS
jgi:hypothetical protein